MERSAQFSGDRVYRWQLVREWNRLLPIFLAIMLNPSNADALKDDPTTTKMMGYAFRLGCGIYVALNGFAFRSPDPKVMLKAAEPVGPRCDEFIRHWLSEVATMQGSTVLVGWGRDGKHLGRDRQVLEMIGEAGIEPLCFGLNDDGTPMHPNYLANDRELIPFPIKEAA